MLRSSGSSKSHRDSGSNSSGSSGYGEKTEASSSTGATSQSDIIKVKKEKDHKKKKSKSSYQRDGQSAPSVDNTSTIITDSAIDGSTNNSQSTTRPKESKSPRTCSSLKIRLNSSPLCESPSACTDLAPPTQLLSAELPSEEIVAKAEHVETCVEPSLTLPAPVNTPLPEDGFCCVISMHDGVVLFTTPKITEVLGFPRDMWLGRSFTDFIHPKGKSSFTSQIAELTVDQQNDVKSDVHVMLRRYRGLRSAGFGVRVTPVVYEPFKLSLSYREAPGNHNDGVNDASYSPYDQAKLLVIHCTPVKSVFEDPDETSKSFKFSTRHSGDGIVSHVDNIAVGILGYLPQDIIGRNIFDFYHPEDHLLLKGAYETLIARGKVDGSAFKSNPYKFLIANGCCVTLETEWSSFVNPWSRTLEVVIGHHKVLKGPSNPDVFASSENKWSSISENVMNESRGIRENILHILSQELCRPSESVRQQMSHRCQALASFIETLIVDDKKLEDVKKLELNVVLPYEIDPYFSEKDSIMLGEISPHHEYDDSKCSTEIPPSYVQLNYNENLQRFFASEPTTKAFDEGETASRSQEEDRQRKGITSEHSSAETGNGGTLSSESNGNMNQIGFTPSGAYLGETLYKSPHLTEALLVQHNADMEKLMYKKHREIRESRYKAKSASHEKTDQVYGHGVKRLGSHSLEDDFNNKTSKQIHVSGKPSSSAVPNILQGAENIPPGLPIFEIHPYSSRDPGPIELWQPFRVAMTQSLRPSETKYQTLADRSNYKFCPSPTLNYIAPHDGLSTSLQHKHTGIPGQSSSPVDYIPDMCMAYQSAGTSQQMLYPSMTIYKPLSCLSQSPSAAMDRLAATSKNGSFRYLDPSSRNSTRQMTSNAPVKVGSCPNLRRNTSVYTVKRALSDTSREVFNSADAKSGAATLLSKYNNDNMESLAKRKRKFPPGGYVDVTSSESSFHSYFLKTTSESAFDSDQKDKETRKIEEMQWHTASSHHQRDKNYSAVSDKNRRRVRRTHDPPWQENVNVTKDLIFRYQIAEKSLSDILREDECALAKIDQPLQVNEQLIQLYLELEMEGLSVALAIGDSTSCSSDEEDNDHAKNKYKSASSFSRSAIIFEENAPFPSPLMS